MESGSAWLANGGRERFGCIGHGHSALGWPGNGNRQITVMSVPGIEPDGYNCNTCVMPQWVGQNSLVLGLVE